MPEWLVVLSWIAAALGVASALLVVADLLAGHAQHMWIMNVVWPVTALWSGPIDELRPTSVVFWFMMQIGMLAGFVTSYPVNWWLLKSGVKEAM